MRSPRSDSAPDPRFPFPMPLEIGDDAPALTLPSAEGGTVSLDEAWREGPLVLLFFPLAFTSTCTAELCTMRDDLPAYDRLGARVAAVSVDSPYTLARYRADLGAGYPFLSDFNREAARAFGVLREGTVGPGLRGVSDRAAFVIGRDGRVAYRWHSEQLGLLPPFEEIRAAVEALRTA
jgi:glutaredoxin-dependent peroxiredoxin